MSIRHYWNARENIKWGSVLFLEILIFLFPSREIYYFPFSWIIIQIILGNVRRINHTIKPLYLLRMTLYFLPYAIPFILIWEDKYVAFSPKVFVFLSISLGIFVVWFIFKYKLIKIMLSREMIASTNRMERHTIVFQIYNKIGAAICEEMFFRGYILSVNAPLVILLPTSIFLFWLSHWGLQWGDKFSIQDMREQIFIGAVNGLLFILSQSILPCVLLHLLINLILSADLLFQYDRWYIHQEKYDEILAANLSNDELEI